MLDSRLQACCNYRVILTSRVIKHFGSVAKVAEFFGIYVQAVYQWGKHVPRERELELMLRLPSQFGAPAAERSEEARAS
jgi:hypothetical protein